jgi:hypothetical protein
MKTKNSVLIENVLLSLLAGFLLWGDIRHYLFLPYTDNEGAFVLIGREMGRGARLYADLWDHKPPLLFVQSWLLQLVFPLTEIHLHLYAFFIHILNAFLIFRLARRLEFSRWGAWASVLAYVFLLIPPLFQTWTVEADLLIQPFLLLSFWAAFSKNSRLNFLSGALWAAAFFTKQSALFLLPVYLMAGSFSDIPKIFKWLAGAGLVAAAVVLPFALDGRWVDFYDALIGFNQHYIEKGWLFFFATPAFRDFLVQWLKVAGCAYGFVFLYSVLGSFGPFSKPLHPRTLFFLSVWFLGVLTSCCVSGYFFTYYFIALLPPLALGMGLALMKMNETRRFDLGFCFLVIAVVTMLIEANTGGLRDKVFAYAQYPWPRYFADKAMGMAIASEAKPNDRLLVWGDDPQIYVYAGLSPSVKTPFINHLDGRPADALKTLSDFDHQPPRYCVMSRMDQVLQPPDWFEIRLKNHYTRVKTIGDLDLYRRLDKPILK